MGVQNPNSTSYVHPDEPNLLNIHKAMTYDPANGEPHLRVTLGSDNITVTGNVNLVEAVRVNNTEAQMIPMYLVGNVLVVNQGTTPWVTTGNANVTVIGNVSGITTLPAITGNVGVSGNVSISQLPGITVTNFPAFPSNVSITSLPGITVTNFPSNVRITDLPGIAVTSMPEVEIKNDTGNPVPVSANTSVNSSNNPIYIAGNVSTIGGSAQGKLWFFQIAQGLIPGYIPLFKAGYNPSVANNSEESIWAHSELYPWSSWGAGGTLSCVSASASDVGTLEIVGLRASDWTQVTETVTMTGVTPVVTTNSFVRVNNVHYSHTSQNVGEIHVNRNGTCVAHIDAGNGQGQMAQYTVPAGYTAYLLTGNANLGKGNDGTGKFRYRLYGSSFQTAMTFLLFQSTFDYKFEAPLALPEKTDLDVTLIASVSGTAVSCAYSMILVANGY